MKNQILVISDYSNDIGGAHLLRDVELIKKLNVLGTPCSIMVPDNQEARRDVPTLGLPETTRIIYNEVMGRQTNQKETFAPFHPDAFKNLSAEDYRTIVIDSYRASKEQLCALKSDTVGEAIIVVIDDSNIRQLDHKSAHLYVNVNLPKTAVSYGPVDSLHVPDYHMVKPEFFNDRAPDPNQVFMAFSGLDDGRVAIETLKALKEVSPELGHPELNYKVALRQTHPAFEACKQELIEAYGKRIEFIQRYDGPKIMGESGLFIGNTGQVSFEAISSGLPIIGLFMLGDPVPTIEKYYSQKGVIVSDISNIMAGTPRHQEIRTFVEQITPQLKARRGIQFERPKKDGFKNLAVTINRI